MQTVVCRSCGKKLYDGELPGSITAMNDMVNKLNAECECQRNNKIKSVEDLDFTGMSPLEIQQAVEQFMSSN